MARPWSHTIVALGLVAITASTPLVESSSALAEGPSASSSVTAGSLVTDLSDFGLPDEAGIPADAGLDVPDTLPERPNMTFDGVAARAGSIVSATDPADWNLGPLAERLEYAPEAAFQFVRDSIGYDPYPGVLRGARGTLAARAGNDIDRALLLQALLDRMVVPSRLVVGTLDDASTGRLLARSFLAPARALPSMPIDSREVGDLPALAARAHRDYAVVRQTLGARDAQMDGSANAAAASEARQHVWVQMRFGTEWLDLDPSMPDSQPGQTLAPVTRVLDEDPGRVARYRHRAGDRGASLGRCAVGADGPGAHAGCGDSRPPGHLPDDGTGELVDRRQHQYCPRFRSRLAADPDRRRRFVPGRPIPRGP